MWYNRLLELAPSLATDYYFLYQIEPLNVTVEVSREGLFCPIFPAKKIGSYHEKTGNLESINPAPCFASDITWESFFFVVWPCMGSFEEMEFCQYQKPPQRKRMLLSKFWASQKYLICYDYMAEKGPVIWLDTSFLQQVFNNFTDDAMGTCFYQYNNSPRAIWQTL